ncbi:hypothetical protein Tco_0818396 [Tanacetum coccineum]
MGSPTIVSNSPFYIQVKLRVRRENEGEDVVWLSVSYDMGETGARVTEDVGLVRAKVSSVDKVVVVKKRMCTEECYELGSGDLMEKNRNGKGEGKPE